MTYRGRRKQTGNRNIFINVQALKLAAFGYIQTRKLVIRAINIFQRSICV